MEIFNIELLTKDQVKVYTKYKGSTIVTIKSKKRLMESDEWKQFGANEVNENTINQFLNK